MKSKALIYQSWDDLIFENRNKEYGAYSLRKTYEEKLFLGLLISTSLLALLMFFPGTEQKGRLPLLPDLPPIIEVTEPPIIIANPRPLPAAERPIVQRTDVAPQVVRHDVIETPIEEPIQSTGNIDQISYDNAGVSGTQNGVNVVVADPVETPTPEFYLQPEVYPQYENGLAGMARYLQRNLKYPASARRIGIEGTVFVTFIVNGDGSVSNVEVTRGIHPDCDKEAVRVISKMSGWTGGKQAGYPVRVKMTLPIKFVLN
jgi:periplasmic protein TonB